MRVKFILFTCILILPLVLQAQERDIQQTISSITSQISTERLEQEIETLVSFHNRNTFSDTVSDTRGIGAARRWLYSEFSKISKENGGKMQVYFDWFDQILSKRYSEALGAETWRMANVVAVIPGTRSERMLVINGHYDSINDKRLDTDEFAPGADDDGSGTVALLELARVLAKEELYNTVVLVAMTGEEHGLFGSTYMAKMATETGAPVEGVFANDMIGNVLGGDGKADNTILRCFSPDPVDSPSRNLALYVKEITDTYYPQLDLKMIFRLDRFGRGGDHSPFVREGFAGIRFTEPYENYTNQHSAGLDNSANMDFEYFTRTTALNAAAVYYWAMSPDIPMITGISRTKDYKTKISFICNVPAEQLRGFTLRMRETDNLYWGETKDLEVLEKEENRFWGEVYTLIVDNRDQDYYIFGIASVNKDGYESITATYDRTMVRAKMQEMRKINTK